MGLTNERLALANAILVASSVVCMVTARRAIARKNVIRHRNLMLAAFAAQTVFMALFVLRYVRFANTEYRGAGVAKIAFYAVLLSHEPLAVVSVPLVLCTLLLGLSRQFGVHVQIARMTYPIWLFVSVTGVILYIMLYV
jgi:putative membrane protein